MEQQTQKQQLYCTSHNGEEFEGKFESREAAIAEGTQLYDGEAFFVGQVVPYDLEREVCLQVDAMLEALGEEACDECGDAADDWLTDVADGPKAELVGLVTGWIRKHADPKFYTVDQIEAIDPNAAELVTEADEAGESQVSA